ncbi:MAG: T9SS type A sorting domain-containing protein [Bacteroidales bacterium]|nr:T9SS type A sorting domain-containing protein [Bacteroidales bacterium]
MKSIITYFTFLIAVGLFSITTTLAQTSFNNQTGNNNNSDLTPMEQLGKELFFDKIAEPDNMSCADCHAPQVGFVGPIPGINKKGSVYPGAVPQRFGNRKPPSAAYATVSPLFDYDMVEGLFFGGNFWDGRATGWHLGNPAADQALGPFLNPVEQNNTSKLEVLKQVAKSKYAYLWMEVWGEPLMYDTPELIDLNYDRVGLAIAEYENSSEVNQFTSKFDYVQMGMAEFTEEEAWGEELFNGTGMCVLCHMPPFFTDFTFDNLGTPKNPANPFYDMDEVYLPDGSPINPLGETWVDPGLGGFLETLDESFFNDLGLDKNLAVAENWGKHKVPTLRNVDKRPGNGFTKAYMHNGVFKSLKEVVHFYNTRDVEMWPDPEVPQNVNEDELGNLGLSDEEEDAIVAFMMTLSDGYILPKSSIADAGNEEISIKLELAGSNPFINQTRLSYTLAANSHVSLDIYALNGEKVSTIFEGNQLEGEYFTTLSGDQLEAGIYIVRLQAGNQMITKKVTHIK